MVKIKALRIRGAFVNFWKENYTVYGNLKAHMVQLLYCDRFALVCIRGWKPRLSRINQI